MFVVRQPESGEGSGEALPAGPGVPQGSSPRLLSSFTGCEKPEVQGTVSAWPPGHSFWEESEGPVQVWTG